MEEKKNSLLKEAGTRKKFKKGTHKDCNFQPQLGIMFGKINEYEAEILLYMMQERGCNFFTGCFKDMVFPKEKIL